MTNIIIESFEIILKTFRFVGLYSDKPKSVIKKFWTFFSYFMLISVIILCSISVLVNDNPNIIEKNETIMFLAEATAAAFKLIPFLISGPKIKKCVDFFGAERFAPKNAEEKKIITNCVKVCRRNVHIYASIMLSTTLFANCLALFEGNYKLPMSVWLPYDPKMGLGRFYATFFCISAAIFYTAMVGELVEPLIGGLAYHATSQLKILKYNLRNLDKFILVNQNQKSIDYCVVKYDSIFKTLRHCVLLHNDIIKFVDLFENCFSFSIFCQMIGTMFGLCYALIGLALASQSEINALLYFMSFCVMTFQIFFYCYYGTLLFQENDGLIEAIYMGPWYKYDVKTRKVLLLVMEQSKKKMIVSAGKVIDLTLQTFISVIKSSYSLVAVLNNYS